MCRRSRSNPFVMAALVTGAVLLAVMVAGCGSSSAASTGAKTLTVSAASSLKAAFIEIGKAFDAANGSTTTFNFDGSGVLQKQIEGGAPVDVFASAALKQVTALKDEGLVDAGSIQMFAGNGMVLVVPAGSELGITGFQDLTKDSVKRIAYGDPKIAANGVPAEQILTALGIMEKVRSKVVYAQNVAQATQYVSSGEVDAAILFASEAKAAGDKVKVVATADRSWYTKVAYPICLVSSGTAKDLGQAFVDYVMSPQGQAVLATYGFVPAPAAS